MPDGGTRIRENVEAVRERIAAAATRSGRTPQEVTLVAVTKYVGLTETVHLWEAGCRDFGESRPQELWKKAEAFHDRDVRWHGIGHLQRNKIRRSLTSLDLLHAGDSARMLEALEAECLRCRRRLRVLLEVNVSGDESKHGFRPHDVEGVVERFAESAGIALVGLMAMAGLTSGPEESRREFSALRDLRDRLAENAGPSLNLRHLSMGMSRDFEIAIEEGATLVRVGSLLFEGIET